MKTEILAASDELMTAVFNGVFQGIILTLLVYLVLRFIGRTNAATRYCAWATTLLLVIAVIPAQYLRHRLFPAAPHKGDIRQAEPPLQLATTALKGVPTPDLPNENGPAFVDQNTPVGDNVSPDSDLAPQDCISDLSLTGTESETFTAIEVAKNAAEFPTMTADQNPPAEPPAGSAAPSEAKTAMGAWPLERILNPVSWNLTSITGIPRIASLVMLTVWLGIAALRGGLLLGRLYQIRRVKKTALLAGPELIGLFARLRAELTVRRKVELKLCPINASPVALGFFHPVILLPEEHAHTPGTPETEHILRHELAHVRRRDDWANLAQNFIQAALFFHPAVWWISKRLALEREIACDDYVLQRGVGPRAYALLLADLAGRLKRRDLVFAQGVSSSKSQLQQRINMILNTRRNTSPGVAKARLGFVTASAAIIALLALYAAPRVVLAQPPTTATAAIAATPPAAGTAVISADPTAPTIAIVASADEPESTPVPAAAPDVEPGPKFKPGADALPPKPIAPGAVNVGPLPAPAVEIAGDVRVPRPPRVPGAPSADGSLEERIERLEQMVQSLMAQQGPKHARGALVLRGHSGDEALIDQREMEKMNAKINEMAKKQAEKAEEQAKRAAEMSERANKDFNFNFKWKAEAEQREKGMRQEGMEKQLEALRKAREGLERQMENLDRQIERAERDQERMQEEKERRSELDESKEENASVAEADEN